MDHRRVFVAVLLGAVFSASCAKSPSAARPSAVTIGTTADIGGVNELVSGGSRFTTEILDQLLVHLFDEQPDWSEHPPTVAPALAESWQESADGRRLTIRLRPDLRWSDGVAITSEDVRFSLEAQRSSEVGWPYGQAKREIESIKVVDERTIDLRFPGPSLYRMVDVNDGRILPAHRWRELPFDRWRTGEAWFRERLVSSGPYLLAGWRPGVELVLARNPAYFRAGQPAIDRVVVRVVPDAAALVERLLAGDVDFVDGLQPRDAERIAAAPHLRVLEADSRQFEYVAWNAARPPFDDPRVRRAMTLAIDRGSLIDALWRGYARVAVGPIPHGIWAREPELEPLPFDPGAARALLAEAGFRDGDGDGVLDRGGRPLRFEILTNSGNRTRTAAATLIRDQLRRVGVDAQPRPVDFQLLGDLTRAKSFDASLGGWAVDTTLDIRPLFHSAEIGDGWNIVSYARPEVDRALEAARAATDLAVARDQLRRVQRLVAEDQPYTFLCEPKRLAAAAADLEGVEVNQLAALGSLPRWKRDAGPK
jgi:peptide/nickel transport system substrate-binding protein